MFLLLGDFQIWHDFTKLDQIYILEASYDFKNCSSKMKNTKICSFNLPSDTIKSLKDNLNMHLYDGSIGQLIKMKYGMYANSQRCLPNTDSPKNLHEYEILIIDLVNYSTVDYVGEEHIRRNNKTNKNAYLMCYEPQTIFDPRAFSLSLLQKDLMQNLEKGALIIVFCSEDEKIEYHFGGDTNNSSKIINTYSFLAGIPNHNNKHGQITKVAKGKNEIYNFLKKFNDNTSYHIVFDHAKIYVEGKYINDPNFYPLMFSNNDDIISFCSLSGNSGIFFFPDIHNKSSFLEDFLKEIAPNFLPALFPEIVKNKWLDAPRYIMPNQDRLLLEKDKIEKEYEKLIASKQEEIENNKQKYSFLADLIIETDQNLVTATIKFLKWIGFEDVVDADTLKVDQQIKEEDIQINTEKGLIIIEVKGIGGTSKDSDCSQINKIKYRRAKERGNFDVYAHYIVNHQRHIPAEDRVNPPFSLHQISDAENDERGLITTWQLFNIYFAIEEGVISKQQVRESFYNFGYLDFIPPNKKVLGTPKEFFKHNTVVIIDMDNEPKLRLNDKIMLVFKDQFQLATIQSIQLNGENVSESAAGEVGFQLDKQVKKGAILYF